MEIRQTHVVIRAKNFDKTAAFYGETLALSRLSNWEREHTRGICFQAGGAVLEVVGRSRGELGDTRDEAYEYQGPRQKMTLVFLVPSAEKAYEELQFREKNIPGGLRREVDGAMVFESHDPDGVQLLFRESDI